jgi:hypothetical protein
VILDESSVAALAANQRALGFDRVALDFEHNTVPGSPEYERTKEPRDIAAYGTPKLIAGDGLYLEALDWTPSGKVNAKNFADLSPTVARTEDGRVTFVHSAGLVRNGSVFDLSFFSAHQPQPHKNMPEQFITLVALGAALGLPNTATEADVTAKLKTLTSITPFDAKPILDRLATIEGTVSTLAKDKDGKVVDLTPLTSRLDKVENLLNSTAAGQEAAEKNRLIACFSAEGKVPLNAERKAFTAAELTALNVDSIKLLLANTPVTVALSARGKQNPADKGNTKLTADERAAQHERDLGLRE